MNKDKHKYTGFPRDCSPDQLKALDQFRAIVAGLNGGSLDPRWDEVYLLRFLRARKFKLKETEQMWRNYIAWRTKNNVDKIHVYYFPELLQLRKLFPHGYHKYARNHSPIYMERLGFTSPEEIWKVTTPDRLLVYYTVLYEELLDSIFKACTEQRRKETGNEGRVTQTCTILDLKDIKLTQASAAYKFVKPASEMAQNNYPEILGSMFILNAPFLFTGIWAIVKMWIDDKTKEKIHILGSGYKKELLKHVDPANLPDFLDGGLCKCKGGCLGNNVGPWNLDGNQYFPNCLQQAKEEEHKVEEKEAEKVQAKKQRQVEKEEKEKKEEKVQEQKEENEVKYDKESEKEKQEKAEEIALLTELQQVKLPEQHSTAVTKEETFEPIKPKEEESPSIQVPKQGSIPPNSKQEQ